MRHLTILALLVTVAACKRATPSAVDFARAYASFDRLEDPEARSASAATFTKRWKGERYVWEGFALASLCQEATRTCAVSFFTKAAPEDRERIGGLQPRVHFSEQGFAAMHKACAGADTCSLTINGLMNELVADGDMPLAVAFENAEVERATPSDGREWFTKTAQPRGEPRKVRANLADASVPTLTPKSKVF